MSRLTRFFILCVLFTVTSGKADQQPERSSGLHTQSVEIGENMMVVSANPWASEVGYDILKKGGNAIDAAIAIQLTLNVVEPQSSGIGGGAFLLYYRKKDGKILAYDGREIAPSAADEKLFLDEKGNPLAFQDALVGGRAVGVPGLLRMLELAHREEGKLPWKQLFNSPIMLAEKGFPISPRLDLLIQQTPNLLTLPQTRAFFFDDKGKQKRTGTLLKNPELAKTFRLIAAKGAEPFYTGAIAQDIASAVQKVSNPGRLSLEDLAGYQPIKRTPIKTQYRGYTIYGFPPPSSGGIAVAQILGMMEPLNFKNLDFEHRPFLQLFCQASQLAFADRNYYVADPEFFPVPIERLVAPTYLQKRSQLLNPRKPLEDISPGKWPGEGEKCCPALEYSKPIEFSSTSHLCVVDREGNVVSMSTSVENAFGSTLMVDGFFLNNQLTDFSFNPGSESKKVANRVESGKRPMSSMSPTIVFKGDQFYLAIGSAGGARIIDYVAQALMGVLEFRHDVQEVIESPHYTALTKTIDLEKDTFVEEELKPLQTMGYDVKIMPLASGTQAIQVVDEKLFSGVDPRREGKAIGD